ncbi:MAG: hypothetical protein ABIZ30_02715 [Candidatus Limnocylindrales bacterium]
MLLVGLMAVATAACEAGSPSPAPNPTPLPAATSFEEYAVGFCAAWAALFTAVGNPDTAAGSELSKALDTAVAANDGLAAERGLGWSVRSQLPRSAQPGILPCVQLVHVRPGFRVVRTA